MTTDKQRDDDGRLGAAALGLIPAGPSDAALIKAAGGVLGAEVQNLPKYPRVTVKLIGENGNAFSIIGAVAAGLRRDVGADVARDWTAAAWKCGSYDELLRLAMGWVNVE